MMGRANNSSLKQDMHATERAAAEADTYEEHQHNMEELGRLQRHYKDVGALELKEYAEHCLHHASIAFHEDYYSDEFD